MNYVLFYLVLSLINLASIIIAERKGKNARLSYFALGVTLTCLFVAVILD